MPIVLSHKNQFRGVFSQREIVYEAIKCLLDVTDNETLESQLIIRCPSGQIKFDREDGSVDRFCKFNYALICRELNAQSRIAIFDSSGEEYLFAIWLTPINQIFCSASETNDENDEDTVIVEEESPSLIEIEQIAEPVVQVFEKEVEEVEFITAKKE